MTVGRLRRVFFVSGAISRSEREGETPEGRATLQAETVRSFRLRVEYRYLNRLRSASISVHIGRSRDRRAMVLSLSGIKKSYQTAEGIIPVLNGVDLSLEAGESLALTGESGSGKSTLLHLAGGLDLPDSGIITVGGRKITDLDEAGRASFRRREVGLIFQQFNLVPSLDVGSNISFHARLAGRFDPVWEKSLVEALGIGELLARYPEQLSGGQQQRVAIGRTLAARPPLILADEPTGNLDEATADIVIDIMLRLTKSAQITLLLVTHSSRLAVKLDRRIALSGGKVS